jgi:hypothetical protein
MVIVYNCTTGNPAKLYVSVSLRNTDGGLRELHSRTI